jgi:hypothetical protein
VFLFISPLLPELPNFVGLPAKPGVYPEEVIVSPGKAGGFIM